MLEKMESKEESVEQSLTSLGGGESSIMQHPKKKVKKKSSVA
jgi:hypothetical protein